MRNGRVCVGPLREDQAAAAQDRRVLQRDASALAAGEQLTLRQALDRVCEAARRRGVSDRTRRAMFDSHSRHLLRSLGDSLPLSALVDGERIRAMVLASRRAGRQATTVWGKDCWLLSHALREAGLPDPVPTLRAEMRVNYKRVPTEVVYFDAQELRGLVQRILEGTGVAPAKLPALEIRQADADLVVFLALTGVRAGELGRLTVGDVDLGRCRCRIREAKDRSHPRTIQLPRSSAALLERIVQRATQGRDSEGRRRRMLPLIPNGERHVTRRLSFWQKRLGENRLTARNLRHTFGTLLIQNAGAAPTEAMAALGHRRIATTSRYVSAVGARAGVIAEQLGRALDVPAESAAEHAAPPARVLPQGAGDGVAVAADVARNSPDQILAHTCGSAEGLTTGRDPLTARAGTPD
ncbi:MAG: tyrosine-type recombinase/integrase [Planctomycetota bacterium]